ncbi:MAG: hypothetical protein AAF420_06025 [Pseudomonadota bacterium]
MSVNRRALLLCLGMLAACTAPVPEEPAKPTTPEPVSVPEPVEVVEEVTEVPQTELTSDIPPVSEPVPEPEVTQPASPPSVISIVAVGDMMLGGTGTVTAHNVPPEVGE